MPNVRTFLVLGRVSNLPTVWTNVLAGTVASLAVPGLGNLDLALLMLSLSLFYVGGMYLNDAFDADIDAAERSSRPIPTGQIDVGAVFALGFAMLGLAVLLAFRFSIEAGLAGVALAGTVVLYDWLHKQTALAPLIMGACRALTYAVAALASLDFEPFRIEIVVAAIGLLAHTAGLTYAAKQEAYDRIERAWPLAMLAVPVAIGAWFAYHPLFVNWPAWGALALYVGWTFWCLRYLFRRAPGDVPRGVLGLIAGIALYDAVMIAAFGASVLAILAVIGFGLTLALQRVVPGT